MWNMFADYTSRDAEVSLRIKHKYIQETNTIQSIELDESFRHLW